MSQYLNREELAELLDCAPQSYTTMVRRLRSMGWPHQPRDGAPPLVLRSIHDKILSGERRRLRDPA